jgi:hypothetical protein
MALPPGVEHWEGPPLAAWSPWSPEQAAEQLAGVSAPWCVIGGWAIDLFLGEQTRPHEDLEIAIARSDFRGRQIQCLRRNQRHTENETTASAAHTSA